MEPLLKCSVCLGNDTALVNTWATDLNNIKWSYKLRLCVPEVDWLEDHLICKRCIDQLETAYEFRDLCLKSSAIRRYLSKPTNTCLNNAPPLTYYCKSCVGVYFRNSNELAQHKINAHFITDRPYNCIYCEKDFQTSLELIHHEVTHFNLIEYNVYNSYNANTELDCQRIEDTSDLQGSKVLYLESSIEDNKESNSIYNCHNCGKLFSTKMLLSSHLELCKLLDTDQTEIDIKNETNYPQAIESFEKEHKCKRCFSLFSTARELKIHFRKCKDISAKHFNMNTDTPKDGIKDEESKLTIKDAPTVPVPMEKKLTSFRQKKRGRKKLDQLSNTCSICDMVFSTRYLVKRHIRNVHATEKNYQCDMCEQKFASPVYLNAHKRYHSGERPHICSFCGKGFITGSDLYHHEKIHANKRAYKCEKCLKAFNTSSDLHKHNLCVHLDRSQWKYVCTFCDRRFPLKTNLDAHTKTHTGERNFACHLCDRKCVNRSVLMRHVKSHSNVRLFKCSLCQLEYKYQKSLDIHMTKAHGIGDAKIPERIKKYFCHICPKSYFANNKLQKHIRTHTGERPFSCQMCEKRFIDKSYVKQHLKTAHNVIFSQTDT